MAKTVIGIAIQNNSGGYFIKNDDVQYYVAVEGLDRQDVNDRFREIVRPHSSFCPCCGVRWPSLEFDEWPAPSDGLSLEHFKDAENAEEINCVLHLIDGSKKYCEYQD